MEPAHDDNDDGKYYGGHLLRAEEEAVMELEQFPVTICGAVKRGEDQTEPAQSRLNHPFKGYISFIPLIIKIVRSISVRPYKI